MIKCWKIEMVHEQLVLLSVFHDREGKSECLKINLFSYGKICLHVYLIFEFYFQAIFNFIFPLLSFLFLLHLISLFFLICFVCSPTILLDFWVNSAINNFESFHLKCYQRTWRLTRRLSILSVRSTITNTHNSSNSNSNIYSPTSSRLHK